MDARSRSWATIVYEDSAPIGWRDIVRGLQIPGFISPAHDFDFNRENGELKKVHWHILMTFPGKKSREQFAKIVEDFGGAGAERVHSFSAYARYLCHLDEGDDKTKYSIKDVISLGGADYAETIASGGSSVKTMLEITQWVDSMEGRVSYRDIVQHAREENRLDWCKLLFSNAGCNAIKSYLWQPALSSRDKEKTRNDIFSAS